MTEPKELLEINIPNHTFTYRTAEGEPTTESLCAMPDYSTFANGKTKDWITIK